MEVLLANPRGFCAGVDRAIEIVERALETFGAPIYVRHEVVHNRFVVDRLRLGYVVDFVEWYVGSFYWPVFNLADSCIVVGAVLMVWYSLRQRELPPA